MLFDKFGNQNWQDVIDVMSLFFKGLIFDEINFGFDERVSENDYVNKNASNGEKDLKCNLA